MINKEVVLDATPEEVVNKGVSVETSTEMPVNTTSKLNLKKVALIGGLTLLGLGLAYGAYKGAKWGYGKIKAIRAAKNETETDTAEDTAEK